MAQYSADLKAMLEAGCHFGHQARRWNPKMKKFIYKEQDGVHIFDLIKTGECLDNAMEALCNMVKSGKEVVFLGAKRQAKQIVREEASKVGAPFVTERWLGGLLTNWDEMEKRIKRLKKLKDQKEKGELKQYTKKEQLLLDREIERLERFFGGVAHLNRRPEGVFMVDTHREDSAVLEATKVNATVFGITDTNSDPFKIDYPIPANDDAVRSIKLIVEQMARAYADGKSMRAKDLLERKEKEIKPEDTESKLAAVVKEAVLTGDVKEIAKEIAPKAKKVIKPTDTKKKSTKKKIAIKK